MTREGPPDRGVRRMARNRRSQQLQLDFPSDLDALPPKKSRRHVADSTATQAFLPPSDDEWNRYLSEGGTP